MCFTTVSHSVYHWEIKGLYTLNYFYSDTRSIAVETSFMSGHKFYVIQRASIGLGLYLTAIIKCISKISISVKTFLPKDICFHGLRMLGHTTLSQLILVIYFALYQKNILTTNDSSYIMTAIKVVKATCSKFITRISILNWVCDTRNLYSICISHNPTITYPRVSLLHNVAN